MFSLAYLWFESRQIHVRKYFWVSFIHVLCFSSLWSYWPLVYLLAKANFTCIWWILDLGHSVNCLPILSSACWACWNVTPTAGWFIYFISCRAVIRCVTVMVLLDEITTIILSCFFFSLFFFLTLIRKTAISFDSYKEFSLCGDTMNAQTINISPALPPILLIYWKWS